MRLRDVDQIGDRGSQRGGDSAKHRDARIGPALLDLDESSLADPGAGRKLVKREPVSATEFCQIARDRAGD